MATKTYERELGELQTKLNYLADAQEKTQTKLDDIGVSLTGITSKFDQMSGAWKATTLIAAVAGVAGSVVWSLAKLILAIPLR